MPTLKLKPTEDFDPNDQAFRKAQYALLNGFEIPGEIDGIMIPPDGRGGYIRVADKKAVQGIREKVRELSEGMLKVSRF